MKPFDYVVMRKLVRESVPASVNFTTPTSRRSKQLDRRPKGTCDSLLATTNGKLKRPFIR